jgi:hypothetical protein
VSIPDRWVTVYTDEPVFIQALVPESPIARFDVCVLVRLAWLDQPQGDAMTMCPGRHRSTGGFRVAVAAVTLRQFDNPLSDILVAAGPLHVPQRACTHSHPENDNDKIGFILDENDRNQAAACVALSI